MENENRILKIIRQFLSSPHVEYISLILCFGAIYTIASMVGGFEAAVIAALAHIAGQVAFMQINSKKDEDGK